MFGYVKPFDPHMRMCDHEAYEAVREGLRRTVGKKYGAAAKKAVSSDFVLLAMLDISLGGYKTEMSAVRSNFKKIPCIAAENGFDYTAAAGVIITYAKKADDLSDKRFLKKLFGNISLKRLEKAYKKASEQYGELAEYVSEQIRELRKLEKENCKSIDRASEPVSNILAKIASEAGRTTEQQRILSRFGYLLGRYVYIADAFETLEQDFAARSFNPLVMGNYVVNDLNYPEVKKKTEDSVGFTLGSLSDCYVQLEFELFKPIVDNIVNLGLKNSFYDLIRKKEEPSED